MNEHVDSELRARPSSIRNWFESLLVMLHIRPSEKQKYINDVLSVGRLMADVSRRCRNNGMHLYIRVDWKGKHVFFERLYPVNTEALCHEMSFDEILTEDFDPQNFVAFTLYRKY